MISQATITKIEKALKISGLAEAIKAEAETTIDIPEVTVLTEDELKSLKSNIYNDGKKAGIEMEVDAAKKEAGLEFQGKSIKGLMTALEKKVLEDAKIEPAEKVKELTKDIDLLRKENEKLTSSLSEKQTEAEKARTDVELFKEVPETTLSAADLVAFARVKGLDFKLEGGKIVPYKGGEVVKDHLANPKPAKEVLAEFAKEHKLASAEPPGGRGGSDNRPPAAKGSIADIKKDFEAQGKSTLGEEFNLAVQAAAKDNPEFKM